MSTDDETNIPLNSLLNVVSILSYVFSSTRFLCRSNTSLKAVWWAHLAPLYYTLSWPLLLSFEPCRQTVLHDQAELCRFWASCFHSADTPQDCSPASTESSHIVITMSTTWWHCIARFQQDRLYCVTVNMNLERQTHRMTIFSPGDGWGGDPEDITGQSERLLQGDGEVQRLVIVLDLWGN